MRHLLIALVATAALAQQPSDYHMQGFLLGRPVPAGKTGEFLRASKP